MSLLTNRRAVLTQDFFPAITPYIRWARTPLGSLGLAALASGLCGMFLHPQGFVVGFGVLVVTTLGLIWPWLIVRGLNGSLSFDRSRCREGEPVAARLILGNRMPWGAWGVSVRGGFPDPVGNGCDDMALAGLAFVPGWRSIAERIEFIPACRGEYPSRQPRVVCGFPFGLWEASRPLNVTASLLVWPRTFPVAAVPEIEGSHAFDGLATRDCAGHSGDPRGVRPYRRGDPIRRVHWGLTARHGELIVRELQSNAVPRVRIVLDTRPAAHAGSGPGSSREWAIRVAASLAEGWIGQGAAVELVLDGKPVPSRGSARARTVTLLDALARLAPGGDRDLAELLSLAECQRSDGGLRVIITTDVGLHGWRGEGRRRAGDRFVVLKAGAFVRDAGIGPTTPLSLAPWIVIDGPGRVATCLLRAGKEIAFGR
ncbi:MAG: DUF58 domain-containing protein [Isosphaeraceae bacterium]